MDDNINKPNNDQEIFPQDPDEPESPEDTGKTPGDTKIGDIDEVTGEPILYIVYSSTDFIVTIDEELSLNWLTTDDYTVYAPDFGEVVGSCDLSDALIDRIFDDDFNRFAYKKLLGSVIGRILDDKDSTGARKLLAIIDDRISEHGKERVRMIYMYSAIGTVLVVGFLLAIVVLFGGYLQAKFLDPTRYQIILSILLGGVGAFITTFARFNNYKGSLIAGVPIHRLDGFLRIFYGLVAGLIIYLAMKANVLIGFASDTKYIPWLYYFIAMVAGASEVLIPNLIKQTEGEVGIKKLEKKEKEIKSRIEYKKNESKESTNDDSAVNQVEPDEKKDKPENYSKS